MTAILSETRQVTVPEELCAQLGITPGAELELAVENGGLMARKKAAAEDAAPPPVDPRDKWIGKGKGFVRKFGGVDAYLRMSRGRDEDGD